MNHVYASDLAADPMTETHDSHEDIEVPCTVISINLHRRHLDINQRALIAARLGSSPIAASQPTASAVSQKNLIRD